MQLSKKLKFFFYFFTAFLKSPLNFEQFEKKDEPYSLSISKIVDGKKSAYVNA